jgi:hypothetical protein
MPWKEVKEMKKEGILGHWETEEGSMITITKGMAHVVHKGRALAIQMPEGTYPEDPAVMAKMLAKRLDAVQ